MGGLLGCLYCNGEGTYTHADGRETLGEWKFDKSWNAVVYDSSGSLSNSYKSVPLTTNRVHSIITTIFVSIYKGVEKIGNASNAKGRLRSRNWSI